MPSVSNRFGDDRGRRAHRHRLRDLHRRGQRGRRDRLPIRRNRPGPTPRRRSPPPSCSLQQLARVADTQSSRSEGPKSPGERQRRAGIIFTMRTASGTATVVGAVAVAMAIVRRRCRVSRSMQQTRPTATRPADQQLRADRRRRKPGGVVAAHRPVIVTRSQRHPGWAAQIFPPGPEHGAALPELQPGVGRAQVPRQLGSQPRGQQAKKDQEATSGSPRRRTARNGAPRTRRPIPTGGAAFNGCPGT